MRSITLRQQRSRPARLLGGTLTFAGAFLLLCIAASVAFAGESAQWLPDKDDVNGEIIAQELEYEQGHTVLHVWGSHYEMGYANSYLLADYIQLAYEQFSSVFWYWWDMARDKAAAWTFLPLECEDEFQGMLAGVRAWYPETTMDVLDLKAASTVGDWLYGVACRSTCCWDELVESPQTTLAMRKLQFMEFPPEITQQWHHVICAWEPDDGSPLWINFGFPSYISAVTGMNEYGTTASLHDWNSNIGPDYADALPRTMASRYVLTLDLGPDPMTHLQTAFDAIAPYHAATGGFLNYYVPDGGAGVIKHSKSLGFYDFRVPQPEWIDGHVISTNNSDISGTYGISPWAPYYESLDPQHGVRATMQGLWETGYQSSDLHMVALGFRDWRNMTIWFEGRLQYDTTGRVELEWSDLFRDPGSVDPLPPAQADAFAPGVRVLPAYPNPAIGHAQSGGISIPVVVSMDSPACGPMRDLRLRIYDPSGRVVRTLAPESVTRTNTDGASHTRVLFRWDGCDAPGTGVRPGVYLYKLAGSSAAGRVVWLGR